jgi:5-methyltetrahydropteroyltriglutamate--homocysteine methyltransferase
VTVSALPILPTTVVGSYAIPAWLWAAYEKIGAGVLDLKNFYVESAELVARRIRRVLESVPAERLWVNPDCGLARLPRHLAFAKLQALVAGTRQVRETL